MEQLVEQAMHDGAVGMSTALIYPPGRFATTDELIALARHRRRLLDASPQRVGRAS